MELRHLRYFVAVAEESHVTRAAERLGIQQPPLSQQIQALEAELDVQLFRRKSRGVELTDVGTAFFDDASRILRDVDRAIAKVKRTARGEEGRVVVGFTSSAPFHPLIQRIIRLYREQLPGVTLVLRESDSADLVQSIGRDAVDAAFIRSSLPKQSGVSLFDVIEEPMVAALPKGHALAAAGSGPLRLRTLSSEPFVLYRRAAGAGLYDAIVGACRTAGFTPRIEQEAPWVGATLSLVAAGLGVTIVPESLSSMQLEGVTYRQLAARPCIAAPICLACRQPDQSAAARAFVALVRAEASLAKG